MINRRFYLRLTIIFLFIGLCSSLFTLPSNTDIAGLTQLLEDANIYFRQANETALKDAWEAKKLYEKAALHYEKIIYDGLIKNGKLYYNLGNAYIKMGELGRAILYYLKAEQYIPADKNLLQNLAYARSKRTDKVVEKQESQFVRILFFWHYDIPSSIRLVIFIVFFLMFWIFAVLKLFFHKDIFNFFLILSIVFVLLFFGSLFADTLDKSSLHKGVVLSEQVTAYKGDSATYDRSFQEPLHSGLEFILIESRRGWYNIELMDGRTCWIPEKDAGLVRG